MFVRIRRKRTKGWLLTQARSMSEDASASAISLSRAAEHNSQPNPEGRSAQMNSRTTKTRSVGSFRAMSQPAAGALRVSHPTLIYLPKL